MFSPPVIPPTHISWHVGAGPRVRRSAPLACHHWSPLATGTSRSSCLKQHNDTVVPRPYLGLDLNWVRTVHFYIRESLELVIFISVLCPESKGKQLNMDPNN